MLPEKLSPPCPTARSAPGGGNSGCPVVITLGIKQSQMWERSGLSTLPSLQRPPLLMLNKWSWQFTFPLRRLQVWACVLGSGWSTWALLRVSDMGEEAGNLEMFVFSVPMVCRTFSQKILDGGEMTNTHFFSGVHQPWPVKAFHVVLIENASPHSAVCFWTNLSGSC